MKTRVRVKTSKKQQLTRAIRERFVKGLLLRKEAGHAVDGKLPPGATHEIVEEDEELPVVRRRRFSLT
jgi:hypothetical protein